MVGEFVKNEFGKKQLWPNFRYYHGSCLKGLRKTTKISVWTVVLLEEIRTRYLPNTSQALLMPTC
jgi:hypothetical protein